MGLGHHIAFRILQKSWTAGIKDPSKANYTVAQKRFEAELTWQDNKEAKMIPFVNEQGHNGIRLIVE